MLLTAVLAGLAPKAITQHRVRTLMRRSGYAEEHHIPLELAQSLTARNAERLTLKSTRTTIAIETPL